MRRSRKKYERPLRPWSKERIKSEGEILKKFGLRRKRELWTAEALLRKYRRLARELAAKKDREREKTLIQKLVKMGILNPNSTLDDVLSLTVEDILSRRLQTIVSNKKMTNSIKQARQFITHGFVEVDGRKVVYPNYLVNKDEENKIQVKISTQSKKVSE